MAREVHTRRKAWRRLGLLPRMLLLALCSGCQQGTVDVGDTGPQLPLPTWKDQGVRADQGLPKADVAPQVRDGGARGDSNLRDRGALEARTPDAAPQTGLGGPCPCKAPLLCVWKVCRAPCKQSGGCDERSDCPAAQACIAVTDRPAGTFACVPGAAAGATCDANTSCRNGTICATVSSKPYQCLATCPTPSASCGQGGLCIPTSKPGCNLCASP